MKLVIPMTPISVNHYKKPVRRGNFLRWYVTPEAQTFKEAVALLARKRTVEGKEHKVSIAVYMAKGQRGDTDNFGKLAIDSLVFAGVLKSDATVSKVCIERYRDIQNPRTEIVIETLGGRAG